MNHRNHQKELFHIIITDEDVGESIRPLNNPLTRFAARGIIVNEDNQIALLNKVYKNEYKLPGGGIENDETPEEAFLRETLEETGCQIRIMNKLGVIEEHKSKNNFKQISHVFLGKVVKDFGYLSLTEKEKNEGAKLIWVCLEEALSLIIDSYHHIIGSPYESIYQSKFIVFRDLKIIEFYKKLIESM